jgi:hypothetical protein
VAGRRASLRDCAEAYPQMFFGDCTDARRPSSGVAHSIVSEPQTVHPTCRGMDKVTSWMTHTPARLVRSLALGPKPDACSLTVTSARVGCGGLRVPLDPRVMDMAVTAASRLISRPLLKVWTVGWKQGPGVPST